MGGSQFQDDFQQNPDYRYDEFEQKVDTKEGFGDGQYDDDMIEEEPISQEDYWTVINSFFDGKGLVRQQLESYNEFVENTMQELVDENMKLTLDQFNQYSGGAEDETVGLRLHSCADM